MNVFIWLTLIFRECWNLVDNHPICLHMEMQSMNEWMNESNHMIINVNVAARKFLCLCLFVLISWMLNVEWWMINSLFVCLFVCWFVCLIDLWNEFMLFEWHWIDFINDFHFDVLIWMNESMNSSIHQSMIACLIGW